MSKKKWAILIVIVVVMVIINIPYEIKYNLKIRLTEGKENRTINEKVLNEYIDKEFGILKDIFNIKYKGAYSKQTVRGMHGWYYISWIRAYNITTPIMKNTFEIWIDNRNHEVYGDNFYDTLSTDSKFQHLYSNYIKKEIGLGDEDVELEFKGAVKYGQQVGEKPKIDFSEINANEDINEQICKNLKNLYLTRAYVNNCTMNQKEEILNYAIELEKKLKKYVFADGEKQLYFEINLIDDVISQYYIVFDYNKNIRKYSIYDKNWNATDWEIF